MTTFHNCCWLLFSLYTWTAILDFILSPTISYVLLVLRLVGNLSRFCIPITTALNRFYIILGNVLPYGKRRSGEISPKDETTCEYCPDTVWTADLLNIFWYASIYGRQFAAVFCLLSSIISACGNLCDACGRVIVLKAIPDADHILFMCLGSYLWILLHTVKFYISKADSTSVPHKLYMNRLAHPVKNDGIFCWIYTVINRIFI